MLSKSNMRRRERIPIRRNMNETQAIGTVRTFLSSQPTQSGDDLVKYMTGMIRESAEEGDITPMSLATKQIIAELFASRMPKGEEDDVIFYIKKRIDELTSVQSAPTTQANEEEPIQSIINDYAEWMNVLGEMSRFRTKRSIVEVVGERTNRFLPGALQSVTAYALGPKPKGGRRTRRRPTRKTRKQKK